MTLKKNPMQPSTTDLHVLLTSCIHDEFLPKYVFLLSSSVYFRALDKVSIHMTSRVIIKFIYDIFPWSFVRPKSDGYNFVTFSF